MNATRGIVAAVALIAAVGIGVGIGLAGRDTIRRELDPRVFAQAGAEAPIERGAQEQTVIRVARQASPAVVSVSRSGSSGSGVIVRREGIILTNAHVVGTARQVVIGLADGRRVDAEVIGRDPTIDIAVVRMPVTNAPIAPIGDSDRLEVGQDAIAIGNPLGLDRTVTSGVVSAINRSPEGIALEGLIQTDAAISPGNSGGPLLDSQGRVIGINTAVLSAPGASGLGFAVPINLANDIVQQVITTGRYRRVFVGIQYADIGAEMAEQFDLPVREGIIISAVVPGSPAAAAGIRAQDIVTAINGVRVTRGGDLRRELRGLAPGAVARLARVRPGGRTTVNVRLAEASE